MNDIDGRERELYWVSLNGYKRGICEVSRNYVDVFNWNYIIRCF